MRTVTQSIFICLTIASGAIFSPCLADGIKYNILDLGTLTPPGLGSSQANALNDAGQVVGVSVQGTARAFRSQPNSPLVPFSSDDLGSFQESTVGFGVNATGQVVGSYTLDNITFYGYRTTGTNKISLITDNLGGLGGKMTIPQAINASGQTVGYATTAGSSLKHAFRTAAIGQFGLFDLGALQAGQDTVAYGINAAGQVVGPSGPRAFRTAPNAAINPATDDLGDLGGGGSNAFDITSTGRVVGLSLLSGGEYHAYLTGPNTAITSSDDLGTLGGINSLGMAVNEAGQVVGKSEYQIGSSIMQPFLYSDGLMVSLESLINPALGWQLQEARDINNNGQIVGWGLIGGYQHAYLMTPISDASVPEPASIAVLAGLGALSVPRKLRR